MGEKVTVVPDILIPVLTNDITIKIQYGQQVFIESNLRYSQVISDLLILFLVVHYSAISDLYNILWYQ